MTITQAEQPINIYQGVNPLELPCFTYAEITRWLKMPASTVRDRIRVSRSYSGRRKLVSFQELYELWFSRSVAQGGFDYEGGLPFTYHPAPGVDVNPRVSFGRPCLAGTGTSTAVVMSRIEAGECISVVAKDYGLSPELIEAAVAFETS